MGQPQRPRSRGPRLAAVVALAALAATPGDVHGKSGTAEYGGGDPPPTHAWFIAYRGDVAIAVLVENERSGGSVDRRPRRKGALGRLGRAPIAARFFAACDEQTACG